MNLKRTKLFLAGIGAVLFAPCALALPILTGSSGDGGQTWTASDSDGRDAEAIFTATALGFTIKLSSFAASTSQPNEILVGLIFDFADGGDPIIQDPSGDGMQNTFAAAIMAMGPSLWDVYGADHGDNLDGEYGFRDDLFGPTGGLGKYGFAGSSYDPLGFSQVIESAFAYVPPTSPNGAEFGIAAGDITGLVSSITFWVDGYLTIEFRTSDDFDYALLEQVHFLYGTDFESTTEVPEPGTLALLGIGLLVIGFSRRRRKIYIRD